MPAMSRANGGNGMGMRPMGQPIRHHGPDSAAFMAAISRLPTTWPPGDQQHHARPHGPRLCKAMLQPYMRFFKGGTMQIKGEVRRKSRL